MYVSMEKALFLFSFFLFGQEERGRGRKGGVLWVNGWVSG